MHRGTIHRVRDVGLSLCFSVEHASNLELQAFVPCLISLYVCLIISSEYLLSLQYVTQHVSSTVDTASLNTFCTCDHSVLLSVGLGRFHTLPMETVANISTGTHVGEYEDGCLSGCYTLVSYILLTF